MLREVLPNKKYSTVTDQIIIDNVAQNYAKKIKKSVNINRNSVGDDSAHDIIGEEWDDGNDDIAPLEIGTKEENYSFTYYPDEIVDKAIISIVDSFKDKTQIKRIDEGVLDDDDVETGDDDPEYLELGQTDDKWMSVSRRESLRALSIVYPDIDLKYLRQTLDRFEGYPEAVQTFLESNMDIIPERRQIQALQLKVLSTTCSPGVEKPWQCPSCKSWRLVKIKDLQAENPVIKCEDILSCGEFCGKCNKMNHHPFQCRKSTERILQYENEIDIFKKLTVPASEEKASYRVFNLTAKTETNFADPLDILFTTAEGTFLRMLKRFYPQYRAFGGGHSQDDPGSIIKEIKYYENDPLAERFEACRKVFEVRGIPTKERLVFHGTRNSVDSIMQQGFLLSKCKRMAHGYGIYFSEFPDISQGYGNNLLLCRVLVGVPYVGGGNIPAGYNSKLVRPTTDGNGKAEMVIIDKEEQILPAFEFKLKKD